MKIATIVGARPQFIKAAMLSRELKQVANLQEVIIHTGQHYDANMSDVFFTELGLQTPAYNLGIHKATHGAMTGEMLIEIEKVLLVEQPDLVVVYGDTDSTLAGALAAAKLHIPVAHIEAGLRSFNRAMPEEINRVVTDHVSDLLFAPTPTAIKNLQDENCPESAILLSGDIMFDAAIQACSQVDESALLETYGIEPKAYTLVTLHRAENTDTNQRLLTWLEALNEAGKKEPLILPLHPRTKQRMSDLRKSIADFSNIRFIDPVGYETMAILTKNARLVATDSGGLQKEAYFHRVPSLILRKETEWVELIDTKWSQLIDCDREVFLQAFDNFNAPTTWQEDLFGNGQTASFIARTLVQHLG